MEQNYSLHEDSFELDLEEWVGILDEREVRKEGCGKAYWEGLPTPFLPDLFFYLSIKTELCELREDVWNKLWSSLGSKEFLCDFSTEP